MDQTNLSYNNKRTEPISLASKLNLTAQDSLPRLKCTSSILSVSPPLFLTFLRILYTLDSRNFDRSWRIMWTYETELDLHDWPNRLWYRPWLGNSRRVRHSLSSRQIDISSRDKLHTYSLYPKLQVSIHLVKNLRRNSAVSKALTKAFVVRQFQSQLRFFLVFLPNADSVVVDQRELLGLIKPLEINQMKYFFKCARNFVEAWAANISVTTILWPEAKFTHLPFMYAELPRSVCTVHLQYLLHTRALLSHTVFWLEMAPFLKENRHEC